MKYYSSICLLCKDENEYLNEWIKWHLDIGFEHFYVYDNNSKVPLINSVKEEYKQYCDFIEFNYTIKEYKNIQIICYTKCLQEFKNDSEWIAFIDTDEFIKLYEDKDINSFLKKYEGYNGVYVNWLVYNADGQVEKIDKPVKERFNNVIDFPFDNQPMGKSIIRPKAFLQMSSHFPVTSRIGCRMVTSDFKPIYNSLTNKDKVDMSKIVLEHYITRSYEEWIEKIERGSLMQNFERKLDEFFIFNEDMRWLNES